MKPLALAAHLGALTLACLFVLGDVEFLQCGGVLGARRSGAALPARAVGARTLGGAFVDLLYLHGLEIGEVGCVTGHNPTCFLK